MPLQFRGIAPGALMRSFSLQSTDELFDDARDLRMNVLGAETVDLVNMSLGNDVALNGFPCTRLGIYSGASRVVDSIVLGLPATPGGLPEPAVPFIQAVGNERQAGTPCGEFGTVGSPAVAKNSITVGATSADPNSLMSSSSLGPTADGRIRPDLVATGCARSTIVGGSYGEQRGTSVASPVVAGVVGLLIEEWRQLHRIDEGVFDPFPPHTIKAVLIHTATDLGLQGPDYRLGWGRVDAQAAADIIASDWVETLATSDRLIYQDSVGPGDTWRPEEFISDGSTPQKFTLVWDDPLPSPMTATDLMNNLDLRVTDPAGTVHFPRRPDPISPTIAATEGVDTLNNVEMVIADAMAGEWRVEVVAESVPMGFRQPFTLVRTPSTGGGSGCTPLLEKRVTFVPPWIDNGGDRDFDSKPGEGVDITSKATLVIRNDNELWLEVEMSATEGREFPEKTIAQGMQEHIVFYDPSVGQIELLTDPGTEQPYVDEDHTSDLFPQPPSELVKSFEFVGDTDHPTETGGILDAEAGVWTRVTIITNPIGIRCHPAPTPSRKRIVQVDRTAFLVPAHTGGDQDFFGNGPQVDITVSISTPRLRPNEIWASVDMTAVETEWDNTRANEVFRLLIYTHDRPIESFVTPTTACASYIDKDYMPDRPQSCTSLVREFVVVGDTDGEEAGTRTGVQVDFNPIIFMEAP